MPDQLINKQGLAVAEERIAEFRGGLRGEVIRPGEPLYDSARRIWNASVDKHPGIIVCCVGAGDVVDAVNFARESGLLVAIRGGGHNVGGRALCDGGMVIDLSRMRGVAVDPNTRTARVQGGAKLGDLDRETHLHGLAAPVGVVSATGVAGLTLGGGVGWLVRKYGMAVDNVLSMQVVTAEGKLLTASAAENPDLFWALRGGGGNFGVVVSFEFQLQPVSTVLGGMILFARDRAPELLRFYRGFVESAPEELAAYAGLICAPDGSPVVGVIVCYCGDLAEGERVIQPLRDFGAPILDAIQPLPFPKMQSLLDGAFPDGNQNYWKGMFLRGLNDEAIDAMVAHANRAPSPLSGVVIEYYGGASSRVPASATAFAHRKETYDIGILTQWPDPAASEANIAWTRSLSKALEPFGSGAYLLNFLAADDDNRIRAAFGQNYDRLVEVKNRYDPTNFFSVNQNIKPSV
jgi:hypothetical protein